MEETEFSKITTGTAQNSRFIDALDFNYVKVDERSFEDMLVFSYGLSKLIHYYNLDNRVDGDWSHFLNDETIILSTIIHSEPVKTEISFKKSIFKTQTFNQPGKKLHYLKKCFQEIHGIALKFESWFAKLKSVEDYTHMQVSIRNEIYNAITSKLSPALIKLKAYDVNAKEHLGESPALDYSQFGEIWGLDKPSENIELFSQDSLKKKIDLLADKLQQIFQEFYETLLYLKKKSPDYLAQSMQSDFHYPEVALYLSFLKLYKHNQDQINKLSQRHLEFYFSSILKQKKKEPKKDRVFLKFNLNETSSFAHIKDGERFLAGEDEDGNNILYLSDYDVQVNKVQIKSLKTLYLAHKSFNIKGTEKKIVSNVFAANVPVKPPAKLAAAKTKKTYAPFGEAQEGRGVNDKTMSEADLGFAVSSPGLMLNEGKREITVKFNFSQDSFSHLDQHLEDMQTITGESREEIFIKLFLDAFKIHITTEIGWLEIKRYIVTQETKESLLIIKFDLEGSEPAITAYNKGVHKGNYNSEYPILKFILNNDSFLYSYSFLQYLNMEQVIIEANVTGVKNLQLFSNIGQLSPDSPFYPFGPMPVPGSYFIIGSSEVFNKSLDKLKVNIEWFDLPKHKSGFFGHYEEYKLDIDNTKFEAKLSILDGGRWVPENKNEQQALKLFRTEDGGKKADPKPKSTLISELELANINITPIKQPADYKGLNKNLFYSTTSKRGFIKLELLKPDFGFAHSIYPSILSNITIENSKSSIFKNNKPKPLPKAPYTPLIQSLSLDYASTSVINLSDRSGGSVDSAKGQVYHIHPFGENIVYPDNTKIITKLLPDHHYQGCLMFGFTNLNAPQPVTILVEMVDEFTVSSEDDPPVIEWKYLKNDEWYTLKPTRVLRDDTNGFLKTGIIVIELPPDIEKNNTILEGDKYWLRAAVIKNIEVASRFANVYTLVLSATLSDEVNLYGNHLNKPLPAFTITRSMQNIEGIQSIVQPLDSFSGIPVENDREFYTRVGERLRHKERAIMPWDFERVILDKFSEIYKATCLPNMTSKKLEAPGSVLIVVTPHRHNAVNPNEPLASSELLYKVKSHLSGLASPFARLEVRNPTYERIKIICAVKFTDGYNYGFFIQKLNEQINEYLSGRIASSFNGFDLGGIVNSSDILTYMRTLPYVDFITKFSMIQTAKDFNGQYVLLDTARDGEEKASLKATKPWSVLVPAEEHQITVLVDKLEQHSLQAGIDYLELGNDFIIDN
ncbi:MAG: baseplate J/gp47 family protein [Cytophagaceae bacterium]